MGNLTQEICNKTTQTYPNHQCTVSLPTFSPNTQLFRQLMCQVPVEKKTEKGPVKTGLASPEGGARFVEQDAIKGQVMSSHVKSDYPYGWVLPTPMPMDLGHFQTCAQLPCLPRTASAVRRECPMFMVKAGEPSRWHSELVFAL